MTLLPDKNLIVLSFGSYQVFQPGTKKDFKNYTMAGNNVAANDYLSTLKESDCTITNFTFHTGEILPELNVHYATLGNPDGIPVLLLHGTSGSFRANLQPNFSDVLFSHDGPLDADRYFIIMPDALGHGQSSKPSDGLRTQFPRYNYDDMVHAQYLLVQQHLGIEHLRLVMGHSMGGMHGWLWGIAHPYFMDGIVPMASTPFAMSGRNWIMRRMVIDSVRNDPAWNDGNYEQQPPNVALAKMWFNFATNGGDIALDNLAPTRKEADEFISNQLNILKVGDANDELYWWDASRDYDPSAHLEQIRAHVLAINSEDDERNPPELKKMEDAVSRIEHAQYHLIGASTKTLGHNTTGSLAGLYADVLKEFLDSLD